MCEASRMAAPPANAGPWTRTGGRSSSPSTSTAAPSSPSALTRSPIGRWRIRRFPSTTTVPARTVAAAVRNRAVVPDPRTSISASPDPSEPPDPTTTRSSPSHRTETPNRLRLSTMASVSSARRAPSSRLVPDASAATTRARLVMLLEPGRRTVPATGPLGDMRFIAPWRLRRGSVPLPRSGPATPPA